MRGRKSSCVLHTHNNYSLVPLVSAANSFRCLFASLINNKRP
jgi:hypothetical protein